MVTNRVMEKTIHIVTNKREKSKNNRNKLAMCLAAVRVINKLVFVSMNDIYERWNMFYNKNKQSTLCIDTNKEN